MKQKYWFMLTSLVGVLVAVMIIADLTTKSISTVNPETQEAMEFAEKELGLEGGDTLTRPARAIRIAREAQGQIGEAMRRHQQNVKAMEDVQNLDLIEMALDSALRNPKAINVPSKR